MSEERVRIGGDQPLRHITRLGKERQMPGEDAGHPLQRVPHVEARG
jgi:hypothetical protein